MNSRVDHRLRTITLVTVANLLAAVMDGYLILHARVHHGVYWVNGAYVLFALFLMAVAGLAVMLHILAERRRRGRMVLRWGVLQ